MISADKTGPRRKIKQAISTCLPRLLSITTNYSKVVTRRIKFSFNPIKTTIHTMPNSRRLTTMRIPRQIWVFSCVNVVAKNTVSRVTSRTIVRLMQIIVIEVKQEVKITATRCHLSEQWEIFIRHVRIRSKQTRMSQMNSSVASSNSIKKAKTLYIKIKSMPIPMLKSLSKAAGWNKSIPLNKKMTNQPLLQSRCCWIMKYNGMVR